jgi:hypothetical protein
MVQGGREFEWSDEYEDSEVEELRFEVEAGSMEEEGR